MASSFISFELGIQVLPKHDGERCWTPQGKRIMGNARDIKLAAYEVARASDFVRTRAPVIVHAWFTLQAPKRMMSQHDAQEGILVRAVTPDTDNLRKQLLDAIEDMFFYNDKQVVGGVSLKTWGLQPSVRVVIAEAEPEDFGTMVGFFDTETQHGM